MKAHSSTHEVSDKASAGPTRSARRDAGKPQAQQYDLDISFFRTMKARRVYPLVVQVPHPRGPVPADGPTGVQVAVRPIVPGAVVVPAELPLEVSRPGARATFQVTPLALGRLPEARIQLWHQGRQVQEIHTRMRTKRQLLTWVLLFLAVAVPPVLIHYTRTAPLRGMVMAERPKLHLGQKKEEEPNKPPAEIKPVIGLGGVPAPPPVIEQRPHHDDNKEYYQRPGSPGELLTREVRSALVNNVPEMPGSTTVFGGTADGLGTAYGYLCDTSSDLRPSFILGVVLFTLALGSWALHRPTRIRQRGSVLLAGAPTGPTVRAVDNAETLPLAQAHELE